MTVSLLRREEYRAFSALSMRGKILDVGGSKRSGYHELIKGEHTFVVANIQAAEEPDLAFDAEEPWPIEDASYDGVLFVNVLEHLYKYEHAVKEARRVLVPGGKLAGAVPFMFGVHGSPQDYFRFTKSALERLLLEAGFADVKVVELGTGGFSAAYHVFFGFMRWGWLARACIALSKNLDRFLSMLKPDSGMNAAHMPLGYYFEASSEPK